MIIEGLDGIYLITRKLLQILTVSQDMTRFGMCKDSLIAAVKWAEILLITDKMSLNADNKDSSIVTQIFSRVYCGKIAKFPSGQVLRVREG